MPASLFALAILARSGPLLGVVDFIWTPALAVAVDHKEPKASPPLDVVVGLAAGLPRDAIDVDDEKGDCFCAGRPDWEEITLVGDVTRGVVMED